jgi:hypothetical protein
VGGEATSEKETLKHESPHWAAGRNRSPAVNIIGTGDAMNERLIDLHKHIYYYN